jgi:hypothetical protein
MSRSLRVGYRLKIFDTDTETDTFNSIRYLHDTFSDTLYYENLIGLSANYFSINDYTLRLKGYNDNEVNVQTGRFIVRAFSYISNDHIYNI